ncbi:hypothetical protein V7147_10605 [Bacillus sp. JJ1521]|uniref:hypothetical protein n=1 Tax=Bacillus sp. JJ1521 TaxID=3122957 RepID=UPI002FFE98F5
MCKNITNEININGIYVDMIDSSSGIFVGINNSNNWSSHQKINYGFGTLSSSKVGQNYNYVIDNDFIDFAVENSMNVEGYQSLGADAISDIEMWENNNFDVKEININSLNSNSAVSIGENVSNGWCSLRKTNQGIGRSSGVTEHKKNTNIIIDNDFLDFQMKN